MLVHKQQHIVTLSPHALLPLHAQVTRVTSFCYYQFGQIKDPLVAAHAVITAAGDVINKTVNSSSTTVKMCASFTTPAVLVHVLYNNDTYNVLYMYQTYTEKQAA